MKKVTVEQLAQLHEKIKSGELNGDTLQQILDNPLDKPRGRFGNIYETEVNYDLGLPRLVQAANLGWIKGAILKPENFPILQTGIRKVNLELYEFDDFIDGDQIVKTIEEDGYQVEGLPELLAFVASHRLASRRRPIGSWKQTCENDCYPNCIPFVTETDYGYEDVGLKLTLANARTDGFPPEWCVLVSRKPDPTQG